MVIGHWNTAILTPVGIAKRLFRVAGDEQVLVGMPLNMVGPLRVKRGDIEVSVTSDALLVASLKPSFAALGSARDVASAAVASLPETPLTAVGYNVRLLGGKAAIAPLLACPGLDNGAMTSITGRVVVRRIAWQGGTINVKLEEVEGDQTKLEFNFHRDATEADEIRGWLSKPMPEVSGWIKSFVENALKTKTEGMTWLT